MMRDSGIRAVCTPLREWMIESELIALLVRFLNNSIFPLPIEFTQSLSRVTRCIPILEILPDFDDTMNTLTGE
jgi:hypothetical protein